MFKKIAALEWRNLKASRWLHINFTLMFILILFAILNQSYHTDVYLDKLADTHQTENMQYESFVADLDSVSSGLKEFTNHSINPLFPYSLEIRLIPRAIFTPSGLAAVAIGQSDINAGIYPVRTFSDPINKATVYYNPVSDMIGGFDLAFVMIFLVPLMVIAVSYTLLSEERERGTLQMVLSQPVSLLSFLFDKLLFRFLVITGSVVVFVLISLIATGTSVAHNLVDIIVLMGLITLYILFWFAVSLLVNLFGKSSTFNATTLIGIWMLLVLIVPTVLHLVVQEVHKVPSRAEALVNLRNAEEDAFSIDRNEILDRYFMEHPEFIETEEGISEEGQWREIYEYYKWFYVVRLNIADAISPIVDNYYESLFDQQAYAKKVSAYSPAVSLKEAMSFIAGTSVDHFNHFHASTEEFRLEWMSFIRNKMLREEFVTHDDLEQLPRFKYNPDEVEHGLLNTFGILILHLLFITGLIFLVAKRRSLHDMSKYKPDQKITVFFILFLCFPFGKHLHAQAGADNFQFQPVQIQGTITLDGKLDEHYWQQAPVISGFRQVEPIQGDLARYDSEVRILFNGDYIYIGAKLFDDPGERPRVSSLSRNFNYFENDLFGVVFDTFNNERDAISFQVTPYGNQRDLQVFDDAVFNRDYDVVWYAETQITDEGWTVEIAIPWSSLRYSDENAIWGINFVRRHRRSNEESAWSPWPRAYTFYRMTYAGKMVGIQPPPSSMNLRVQPYTLVQSNRSYDDNFSTPDPKLGGEIKWAPNQNSVLDITFNTDFAQVEADQQVINLSRFPVVFPEKRQFFLENANLFDVGRVGWIKPFFSRRIGLTESGDPVPLDAGFRFTEQSAERSFGTLMMRQRGLDDISPAWFGVGRYLENFGSNKRAGLMFTARHDESGAILPSRSNLTGNADTFMRFPSNITLAANAGASYDSDLNQLGHAGDFWLSYLDDFMYVGLLQAVVSPDYRPGTGFVGRRDVIMTSPAINLNWRPGWRPEAVRAFTPSITTYFYHTYTSLDFEQGYVALRPLTVTFNNGSWLQHSWLLEWHRLDTPFRPAGILIADGRYDFRQQEIQFSTDQSAIITFTALAKHGGFYDGRLTQVNVSAGFRPIPNIYLQSRYIRNMFRELGVESQKRDVDLVITNLRLALNPRLQLSGFIQHNTDLKLNLMNLRMSWEFSPLSYLYLVFNDVHPFGDDLSIRPPGQQQAIFKLSYLKQL